METDRDEAAARVEHAIDSIHLGIQDIRNFILGLRPELLEGASLVAGLAALVEEYRHHTMVDLDLHSPDTIPEPPREVTSHLLAIATETLSNIVRHADASLAIVELSLDGPGSTLELRIEDNGVGFDPAWSDKIGHHGLANIQGRAAEIGAELEIDSQPGAGTRVIVRILENPHRRSAHR
jgi:signal transduction histidine kinase